MAESIKNYKVVIEGNIGCGKSTLLSQFVNDQNIQIFTEPISKWQNMSGINLLQLMYENPKRWTFQFQNYVQLTRLQLWLEMDCKKPIISLVERSIHSNRYVYLEVSKNRENLTMDEYLILTQQYDTICSQFDLKPDMIIYLRSDPVIAYERMVSRGRFEESSAKFNYIKDLNDAYENWLIEKKFPYDVQNVKIIDANLEPRVVHHQISKILEEKLSLK